MEAMGWRGCEPAATLGGRIDLTISSLIQGSAMPSGHAFEAGNHG